MGTLDVNGTQFEGDDFEISNGSLIVDGQVKKTGLSGAVKLTVTASLHSVKWDASVDCGRLLTTVKPPTT